MNLSDNLEVIQRYLTQQMSAEERIAFENQLKSSPELAAEVQSLREWRVVAKHQSLFDTKILLGKISQDHPIEPDFSDTDLYSDNKLPAKQPPFKWILGVMLFCLLLIGILGYWQIATQKHYKTLAINLLQQYPVENIVGLDTLSQHPDTLQLVTAMRFYEQKAYSQAIDLFRTYKHLQKDDIVKFYLAISLLQTGQAQEALPILEMLKQDAEGIIQSEARENYPIALIAIGEIEKAKIELIKMTMDKALEQKAQYILSKL